MFLLKNSDILNSVLIQTGPVNQQKRMLYHFLPARSVSREVAAFDTGVPTYESGYTTALPVWGPGFLRFYILERPNILRRLLNK